MPRPLFWRRTHPAQSLSVRFNWGRDEALEVPAQSRDVEHPNTLSKGRSLTVQSADVLPIVAGSSWGALSRSSVVASSRVSIGVQKLHAE